MPIESFTAEDAFANLKRNRLSRWPDASRDGSRLAGFVSVDLEPSFAMIPGEPVFTIGSCFARNIERRLGQLGFDIPTEKLQLATVETGSKDANGLLNKYTAHSMLNEVRAALDPAAEPLSGDLLEADAGLWIDPHMPSSVPPGAKERVLARRELVSGLYRDLPQSRIVVLTLGLIEAWLDRKTGRYLNGPPPGPALRREPDRFKLDVLTVAETVEALEALHEVLVRFGHPDFRILITVSPVPMKASFTGRDVIAANTYSKSALRAAAEEFARSHERVDYFPSYEIVALTNRSAAYREDNLHVATELIDQIMDSVVARYAPSLAPQQPTLSTVEAQSNASRLYELIDSGDFAKAGKLMHAMVPGDSWRAAGMDEFEFRFQYGRALSEMGKAVAGVIQLEKAVLLNPESGDAWYNLGMAKYRLGRQADAEADVRKAVSLAPERTVWRHRHGRLLMLARRFSEAERAFHAVLAKTPDHPKVLELLAECTAALERQDGMSAEG